MDKGSSNVCADGWWSRQEEEEGEERRHKTQTQNRTTEPLTARTLARGRNMQKQTRNTYVRTHIYI